MTAYQVPPLFEHGDYPQAAGFATKYAAALNHLEECLPYGGLYPVAHNDDDEDDTPTQVHTFTFVHKHRYLHFAGNDDGQLFLANTGQVYDVEFADANAATTLSGEMSDSITDDLAMSVLDLDSVEGLEYGQMYHLRDVWTAIELPTEDVMSVSGGSWTATPSISDGDVLTAANLNIYSGNLEYLRALADRPNEPFKCKYWDNSDGGGSWHYSFRKAQNKDYLYYWFEAVTGEVSSVELKVKTPAGSWSSDYLAAVDTSISGNDIRQGFLDISGLTDGQIYAVSVDVSLSGALMLYMLMNTAHGA